MTASRRNPAIPPRVAWLLVVWLALFGSGPSTHADPLTVEDGVVVKFGDDGALVVRDGLIVAGGATLTSEQDDEVGGPASATPGEAAPGDWFGVRIERSASIPATSLDGLLIRYGGRGGVAGLTLNGTDIGFGGFTIEDCAVAGVLTSGAANSALSQLAVRRNGVGIQIGADATTPFTSCLLEQNSIGAISDNTNITISAGGNWWGHPSGPLDASDDTAAGGLFNPEGLGNPVSDRIDYAPFSDDVPLFGLGFSLPEGAIAGDRLVPVELRAPTATSFRLSEDSTFAGVPFLPLTATTTFLLSAGEGSKTVYAEFQAPTGNTASLSRTVLLDTSGPSLELIQPTAGAILQRPITVVADATDPAGVERVEFLVDGIVASVDTTNTFSFDWDIRGLTEGVHELGVRAVDSIGRETLTTVSVSISPQAPAPPLITSPADGTETASPTIVVSGQTEPFTTVSLYRPVNQLLGRQNVGADGVFIFADALLEEGANPLSAVSSDSIGESAPSPSVTVLRDTGPPDPPFLTATEPGDGIVLLEWLGPTDEVTAFYRIYRSTSSFSEPGGATLILDGFTATILADNPESDGTYFYGVTATDQAGNESGLSNIFEVVLDRTPPTAAVASSPVAPVGPGPVTLTVTVSEDIEGSPTLGITPFDGTTSSIELTPAGASSWTGLFNVTETTPSGAATLNFSARDAGGNLGTTISSGGTLLIDTDGPAAALSVDPSGTVGPGLVTFDLTLNEPAAGTPVLSFLPPAGGSVDVPLAGGPTAWTGALTVSDALGDGVGTFDLEATDLLGNNSSGPVEDATLELDTTAPTVPTGLAASSEPAGQIDLTWDAVGAAAGYAVYRLPATSTFPSAAQVQVASDRLETAYSDTPPADGSFRYAVTASDELSNESGLSVDVVAVSDRTVPDAPIDLTLATEGAGIRLSWSAPAAESTDRFRIFRETSEIVDIEGLTPVQPDLMETTILDVPPADGDYVYGVVVVDLAGNASSPATAGPFTFDQGVPMIEITGVSDDEVTNLPVTPVFTASDFSLESLAATLDGVVFASGTTITEEGAYELTVVAEDSTGNIAELTVAFAIDLTDPSITVAGVTDGASFEGAVTPTFTFEDIYLESFSATLNGAPFESGAPVEEDGTYTLIVQAADLAGNAALQALTFTVDAAPPAPESLEIELTDGEFPTLNWTPRPEPDVAGYRIRRNGLELSQQLVAGTSFTDPGFETGAVNVYELSAVDAGDHEGPTIVATVQPVSLRVASYGLTVETPDVPQHDPDGGTTSAPTVDFDSDRLTRRFLDQVTVELASEGTETLQPGPLSLALSDAGGVLDEIQTTNTGPLAAGGSRQIVEVFPTGDSAETQRTLDLSLELPSEPNTEVRLVSSHTLEVRDTPLPVEVFSSPLVRGAMAQVQLKIFNQGSVPIQILTSLNDEPSPEVEVSLRDTDGIVLSSARLEDRGAGTIVTADLAFAEIPVGGSYLSAPISLQIPSSAPDDVVIEGVVFTSHLSLVGPREALGSELRGSTQVTIGDPEYLALAQTDKSLYDQGEDVLITGQAFDTQTLEPAADRLVKIGISTRGFVRFVFATSDAAGNFEAAFDPFSTEAGSYTLWATHPTVTEKGAQASFDIIGLQLTPSSANVRFSRNGSFGFPLRVKNTGEIALDNLSASFETGFGVTAEADLSQVPSPIEPGETGTIRITLSATIDADLDNFVTLTLSSPAGATRTFEIDVALSEAIPLINTEPSFVDVGIATGQLIARNVRIHNVGFTDLTGITLDEPELPWVKLGIDPQIPSIPPGGFEDITVLFAPDAGVEQGVYSDAIVIRSGNHPPFVQNLFATVTNSQQGAVEFLVKNTEDVELAGATVSIRSAKVPGLEFTRSTSEEGTVLFEDLPAGPFQYKIQAPGHEVTVDTFTVEPDTVTPLTVFLNVVYVSIEWSVTPVIIEDRYEFTLTAEFETSVPAPVLVSSPGFFDIKLDPGGTFVGVFTVTNRGLVAVDDVKILPNGSEGFVVETLISELPRLGAMQSIEVPFRATILPLGTSAETDSSPAGGQAIAQGGQSSDGVETGLNQGGASIPSTSGDAILPDCPKYAGGVHTIGIYVCLAGFEASVSTTVYIEGGTFDPLGLCSLECDPCNCAFSLAPLCKCISGVAKGKFDLSTGCDCLGAAGAGGAACSCLAPLVPGGPDFDVLGCLGDLGIEAAKSLSALSGAFKCGFTIGACLPSLFDFESSPYTGGPGGGDFTYGGYGPGGGITGSWSGCGGGS